eukprot:1102456-Pyramimonas_sp.AAC.1
MVHHRAARLELVSLHGEGEASRRPCPFSSECNPTDVSQAPEGCGRKAAHRYGASDVLIEQLP